MKRSIYEKSDIGKLNVDYLCCDQEYFPPIDGEFMPKSIGIYNATKDKFVRRIHLKSVKHFGMCHPDAVSINEARRLLHIFGKGKIAVMWNADNDLRVFPYYEEAFLGVHCAMIRYSTFFGEKNPFFKDRKWVRLEKAAKEIEFNFSKDECLHDEITDAKVTAAIWNYCDDFNIPQDPYINQNIKKKLNSINETPNLPPSIEELEQKNFELNESYKREQFKRRSIKIEGNNIIVTLGNRYDKNQDKVININFQKSVLS